MSEKIHFFLHDVVKVLATESILHDDKNHFGGFDDFVHLGNGRMADNFKKMELSGNSFNIRSIFDFLLF